MNTPRNKDTSADTPPTEALRILVTGATGFIGQRLCRRLCAEGHRVHATSRRQQHAEASGPRWHQADLADLAVARDIFATVKPDVVFHLAGEVGANPDFSLVLPTFHSLLASTINVLVAAMEENCGRIVLTGSLTEPLPGERIAVPQSPYAAAKWAGAGYGRMYHDLFGAPVVILRPFMTYGPGQAPNKLVPSAALALLRGERPKVSSGTLAADWVYIDDVVEAFIAAATAPGIEGETIDLGTGTLVPMREVIERLVAIVGEDIEPHFGALPDRLNENTVAANTADAEKYFGWRAQTSLDEGLRETVAWYSGRQFKAPRQSFRVGAPALRQMLPLVYLAQMLPLA
jgi:nucleoside-diphosphate-sugar epimerase